MESKLASRKWILSCVTVVLLFICLYAGVLPAPIFQNLLGIVITGYLIANTTQNVLITEKKTTE